MPVRIRPRAPQQHPVATAPFVKGVSGNPGGRPVGSKTRINADFLRELSDAFEKRGREAIDRMIDEEPAAFARVVASLLPKDVTISSRSLSDFTDDDLRAAIDVMQRYIDAGGPLLTIEGEAAVVQTDTARAER